MRCAAGVTILVLISFMAAGCPEEGSFRLQIVFPDDESRAEVSEVHVWALEPGGRSCPALMAGEVAPGEMVVLTELVVEFPQGGESSTLQRVPSGAVMFFASGQTDAGALILRGCTQIELAGGKDWLVVLNLFRVCTPDPGGEIPDNQIDDDCDGSTDECEDNAHCEDQNGCTADICFRGQCEHSNLSNDLVCSDGNPCTQDDKCFEGACTGTAKDCSSYAATCLDGVCDPQTGECTQAPAEEGSSCDDGLYCTEDDTCQQGVCTGSPRDCGDGDDCTSDACNEDQDGCENLLAPRPGAEGPPGDGTCSNGEDDDCDRLVDDLDPNCFPCTTDGECDDGNPCTTDACVANVCQNSMAPDGTDCSDDLFCTTNESCDTGACISTPRDCTQAGDACNQGVCLEDQDRCAAQPKPDGSACEDGLYCTVGDRCTGGACQGGGARDCDDGGLCTEDTCDEGGRRCEHAPILRPGAEGPPNDGTCFNGVDDDCEGLTDGADPDCADGGCPVLVDGNLLTLEQQDMEGDYGNWTLLDNPEYLQIRIDDQVEAFNGCYSLEITLQQPVNWINLHAMGTVDANGTFAVSPNTTYTWTAAVSGQVGSRQAHMQVDIFNQNWDADQRSGPYVSLAADWVQHVLTFTTNPDTAWVQIFVQIHDVDWGMLSAGEKYRVDFGVFRQGDQVPVPGCTCR